ncbi:MAG: hypothetical protein HYS05_13650 [Acidobacteria bacterium]|nr:hypothetical protein [Acidobacteriota bacterium]
MTLQELLSSLADPPALTVDPPIRALDAATAARAVKAVTYDSRRAGPGSVFVALRGQHADGTQFARQAASKGAIAVVAESGRPPDVGLPWIEVTDSRLAVARLAARLFGEPSKRLTVVGITGTNGKTTTGYLTSAIFEAAGIPSGLLGTVQYRIGDEEREAARTTPEAPEVQELLREPSASRDLCDRQAGGRAARSAELLAGRPGLRGQDAARRLADPVASGRPAECLQHPGVGRDRGGTRASVRRDRAGRGRRRRRAGALPDRVASLG